MMILKELTDAIESRAIGTALDRTVALYLDRPDGNFGECESIAFCQAASLEKSCLGEGTIFALVQMLFLDGRLQAPKSFTDWLFSPAKSDERTSFLSDLVPESISIEFRNLFIQILFGESGISSLAKFETLCKEVAHKNISDLEVLAVSVVELIDSYLPLIASFDNTKPIIENLFSIHRLLTKATGLHDFASPHCYSNKSGKNSAPFAQLVDLIDSLTYSSKHELEICRYGLLKNTHVDIESRSSIVHFIPVTEIALVENLALTGHLALARKSLVAFRERLLNAGYSTWARNFSVTMDLLESFVYGCEINSHVESEFKHDVLIFQLTQPSEPRQMFDACINLLSMKEPLVLEFFERNRKAIFAFESLLTSEIQQNPTVYHYLQILFMRSLGHIVDRRLSVRMSRVLETAAYALGSSVCDEFILQIRMDECASLNLLGRDREAAEGYSKVLDSVSDTHATSVVEYSVFRLLIGSLHNMNSIDDVLTYTNFQKIDSLYAKRDALSDLDCLKFEICLLSIFVSPGLMESFAKIVTPEILLDDIIRRVEEQGYIEDIGPGGFSMLINVARSLRYRNGEINLLNAYSGIDSVFNEVADVRVTQFGEML